MEELKREIVECGEIKVEGIEGPQMGVLDDPPINMSEWLQNVGERLRTRVDTDTLDDDTVLATGKLSVVTYHDPHTGEVDVRYEARYTYELEELQSRIGHPV